MNNLIRYFITASALATLAALPAGATAPVATDAGKGNSPSAIAPADTQRTMDSLFEASQKQPNALPDGHPDISGATMGDASAASADPHAHAAMGSLLPKAGSVPPSSLADVGVLNAVPILHEGRLKPMLTYSRHMLLQFSGRTEYEKLSAMQVMSRILFAPELAGDYRIFLINNPEVVEAIGVAAEKNRRYSFHQLEKSLPKMEDLAQKANAIEDEKRNLIQKEILRVFSNLVEFVNLARSFSYALPNSNYAIHLPETKQNLQLSPDRTEFSFWELMATAQSIAKILEGVGNRVDSARTPMEREIILLSQAMYLNSQTLHPSPFLIFPAPLTVASGTPGWLSPPEAVAMPDQLQGFHKELNDWANAVTAYRGGNQAEFEKQIKDYLATMDNRAYEQLSETHFPLEVLYQQTEPFFWGLILYWFALLGCFGFFLVRKRWLYLASLYVFLAGYALHVAGIVSRIIIMRRPPVTSLYETFPFVAAVSILAALFIERINRKRDSAGIGLLCASILGVILLSIANRYAAEGDTMKMLVAVLNSNFWLSTHVVCVTIGYSACLLTGAIGHIWLIRALWPATSDANGAAAQAAAKAERLKEIAKMLYGTLCFGLLFSFIGTVLGGIWADQSWGRFWGWDPKENGALLIVIWCIILLHAKQWGYIRNLGLAMGAVFGAIVVSLAWFGVNLLNVGLHSYGFTTGAATKLFSYIGGEFAFMLITGIALWLQKGSKRGTLP